MKKIIALASAPGGGKTYLSRWINENFSSETFRYSSPLSEILKIMELENNRPNLQNLSQALREKFGNDILEKIILNKIKNSNKAIVVIDGVRRLDDIKDLKKEPNFNLIYIDVDPEIRAERIMERSEKKDDKKTNLKSLLKEEKHDSEIRKNEIKKIANFIIENNGNFQDFQKKIKEILKKILN